MWSRLHPCRSCRGSLRRLGGLAGAPTQVAEEIKRFGSDAATSAECWSGFDLHRFYPAFGILKGGEILDTSQQKPTKKGMGTN